EPEVASNVTGDPKWIAVASAAPETGKPPADTPPVVVPTAQVNPAVAAELEATRGVASPEEAINRLKALIQKAPEGDQADIAQLRLKALENVLAAARSARLNLDIAAFAAGLPPRVAEDAQRALRGDKYAAMRVAETLPQPPAGELMERSDR